MEDDCNIKRHPRSMNEAFPGSPEYACSIEIHVGTKWDVIALRVVMVIAGIVLLAAAFI